MSDTFRLAVVAHMKHGVLYEAIKKRGWTYKRAAEFLQISKNQMSQIINLKGRPPFIFMKGRWAKRFAAKTRVFTERLMELTGQSVEELFPEEFMTREFLAKSKVLEGIRDVPKSVLLDSGLMPRALTAPDEALMQKEVKDEIESAIELLPEYMQRAVRGIYLDGRTASSVAREAGLSSTAVSAVARVGCCKIKRMIEVRHAFERIEPYVRPNGTKRRK